MRVKIGLREAEELRKELEMRDKRVAVLSGFVETIEVKVRSGCNRTCRCISSSFPRHMAASGGRDSACHVRGLS